MAKLGTPHNCYTDPRQDDSIVHTSQHNSNTPHIPSMRLALAAAGCASLPNRAERRRMAAQQQRRRS